MLIRSYEFDDEMLKLFIERLCDYSGGPYDCINKIKDVAYSCKDIGMPDLSEVEYYKNKISELERQNRDLVKENKMLVEENDEYAKDVMKYEKALSILEYHVKKRR